MGNTVSPASPLYLDGDVSWKTGSIVQGISAPQTTDAATFEEFQRNSLLKDFLLQHVDNDHLILSLLNGADDAVALVKGMPKFQPPDADDVASTRSAVNNLQLCVAAGINVRTFNILFQIRLVC